MEAVGARARQGIDASPGAPAPLVGRDAERRLLVDAADRAARERTLQLVTLVGAPGIGKSRLVLERYRELDARPGIVATWRQGRALAYGGRAFDPIADVVRAEAGILETDDPELAADRLRTTVAALAVDEAEREWLHRRLPPLFAEQAEHASRDESYSAWQRFSSCVGNVFSRGGVTALGSPVADEVVRSLTRRDILRRARISSVAGEIELSFRHALVRDFAYAEIPRARRAEKHRLAAEWIASTTAARPDLVAHHYLEAISLGRAVGADVADLAAPAVVARADAGDRAAALGAADTALASYDAALDLAGDNVQLPLAAERAAQLMEAGAGPTENGRSCAPSGG